MTPTKDVHLVEMREEFSECPECGYDNGFHAVFRRAGDKHEVKWILLCPSCAARFDIGLTARLERK